MNDIYQVYILYTYIYQPYAALFRMHLTERAI